MCPSLPCIIHRTLAHLLEDHIANMYNPRTNAEIFNLMLKELTILLRKFDLQCVTTNNQCQHLVTRPNGVCGPLSAIVFNILYWRVEPSSFSPELSSKSGCHQIWAHIWNRFKRFYLGRRSCTMQKNRFHLIYHPWHPKMTRLRGFL